MKHLVIGAGRMGQRHSSILTQLGEVVELVDLGFKPREFDYSGYGSVLICTPPQTHASLINAIPLEIPVFCEKPLIAGPDEKIKPRAGPTLAAVNWFFCDHLNGYTNSTFGMDLRYVSNCPYRRLDAVHFFQWFNLADNLRAFNVYTDNSDRLDFRLIGFRDIHFTIDFVKDPKLTFSRINDKQIHVEGPLSCNMFERQMAHWVKVAKGYAPSVNPFDFAVRDYETLFRAFPAKEAVCV